MPLSCHCDVTVSERLTNLLLWYMYVLWSQRTQQLHFNRIPLRSNKNKTLAFDYPSGVFRVRSEALTFLLVQQEGFINLTHLRVAYMHALFCGMIAGIACVTAVLLKRKKLERGSVLLLIIMQYILFGQHKMLITFINLAFKLQNCTW